MYNNHWNLKTLMLFLNIILGDNIVYIIHYKKYIKYIKYLNERIRRIKS